MSEFKINNMEFITDSDINKKDDLMDEPKLNNIEKCPNCDKELNNLFFKDLSNSWNTFPSKSNLSMCSSCDTLVVKNPLLNTDAITPEGKIDYVFYDKNNGVSCYRVSRLVHGVMSDFHNNSWSLSSIYYALLQRCIYNANNELDNLDISFNIDGFNKLKDNFDLVKDYIKDFKLLAQDFDLLTLLREKRKEPLDSISPLEELITKLVIDFNDFRGWDGNKAVDYDSFISEHDYPASNTLLRSACFKIAERTGVYDFNKQVFCNSFYDIITDFKNDYVIYMKECNKEISKLFKLHDLNDDFSTKDKVLKNLDVLDLSLSTELKNLLPSYRNYAINSCVKSEVSNWINHQSRNDASIIESNLRKTLGAYYSNDSLIKFNDLLDDLYARTGFDEAFLLKRELGCYLTGNIKEVDYGKVVAFCKTKDNFSSICGLRNKLIK